MAKSKRVTLGDLRRIQLPPEKPDEDDVIASIRKNQALVDARPTLKLCVPDAIAKLIPDKKTAAKAPQDAPNDKVPADRDNEIGQSL